MASTSNIEVVGTLYQFQHPIEDHHKEVTPKKEYVAKQVYQGELVQTNEISMPSLVLLGILIISVVFTLRKIHDLSVSR